MITLPPGAPLIISGVLMTLKILGITALISLSLGTVLGMLMCNKLRIRWLSSVLDGITFVTRGIPFYVQLLIVYFALPSLLGINFEALTAAIVALGWCSSAYVAQTIRAGINALGQGQWQACQALGFSRYATLRYIVLPQVGQNILPSIINELDHLVKSTAIVSSIGIVELTRAGMNLISRGNDPIIIYGILACIYLLISTIFYCLGKKLEKRR